MNLFKHLLGGVIIIAVATVIGVAQNTVRSKPLKLFPKVPRIAPAVAESTQKKASEGTKSGRADVATTGAVESALETESVKKPQTLSDATGGTPGKLTTPVVDFDAAAFAGDITSDEFAAGQLSKERVRALTESNAVILVDARDEGDFEQGHLPGAINIPYDHFVDYYDQLEAYVPMDATVVAYCTSLTCDLSEYLAQELQLAGYEKVLLYKGGWLEWTEAGYPIEGASNQ